MSPDLPPATPEAAGLRPEVLETLERQITAELPDVTSLLVARHGLLGFERYFAGDASERRDTQSVTKSVVSLLVGIALEGGLFSSLDQPLPSLLPEESDAVTDPRWHRVTLRHLLTMTCGLPSELTDAAYDDAWFTGADPVRFSLAHPLLDEPGTTFRYSNAGAHLLGAALARAAGQPLAEYAGQVLFSPLGIAAPPWPADPQGRPFASGSLHLTSRELLRFGQLVLQRGEWEGRPLVPRRWLGEATRPHVRGYAWMEGIPDYGFLWWHAREGGLEGWYATGYGGQYVAVFPMLALVVVMTGRVADHPSHRFLIPRIVAEALE